MAKRAYADTRAVRFIERRVLELQARKNQATIAAEAGFPHTRHEVGWIEFLRLASNDSDPAPTLARVQALQRILSA